MTKVILIAIIAALATCALGARTRRSPGGAGWQNNGYDGGSSISAARSSGWNGGSGYGRSYGGSSGWGSGSSGLGARSFGARSSWGGNGGYNGGYSNARQADSGSWGNTDWDNQGYDTGSNFRSIGWEASW